ncbi:MAG: hypothetical protein Q7S98_03545 [Deltaproteobacteria bacterium]|nr:hypothetical protein [Deltaproteobacteria bacterium]
MRIPNPGFTVIEGGRVYGTPQPSSVVGSPSPSAPVDGADAAAKLRTLQERGSGGVIQIASRDPEFLKFLQDEAEFMQAASAGEAPGLDRMANQLASAAFVARTLEEGGLSI